ncbi:hypothetical protein Pelo_5485 [Pelomyxa schiedti]|nr:hypothetical protein Pelo_5485 [Pelomyxa schiedti]
MAFQPGNLTVRSFIIDVESKMVKQEAEGSIVDGSVVQAASLPHQWFPQPGETELHQPLGVCCLAPNTEPLRCLPDHHNAPPAPIDARLRAPVPWGPRCVAEAQLHLVRLAPPEVAHVPGAVDPRLLLLLLRRRARRPAEPLLRAADDAQQEPRHLEEHQHGAGRGVAPAPRLRAHDGRGGRGRREVPHQPRHNVHRRPQRRRGVGSSARRGGAGERDNLVTGHQRGCADEKAVGLGHVIVV